MSWYEDFKTGTKDYLTKGNSKQSKTTSYSKYGSSSWWMSDWDDTGYSNSFTTNTQTKSKNLYKMAAHRRAIANFVSIVTGKNIPVKFNTKGNSYTDGTTVVISSKVAEPNEFDPAVGLALHEGSHIKLSNFKLLADMYKSIQKVVGPAKLKEWQETASKKNIDDIVYTIKDILNWVEDRRIDQFIFDAAPGYRDYYRSMYDKYFNDPAIDKGMQSDELKTETMDSYMFRLINLHSKFSKANALKGLNEITKIAKLSDINRLKTTDDALVVACDIFEVILNNIDAEAQKAENKANGKKQKGNGNGQGQAQQAGEGEEEAGEDDIEVEMGDSGSEGMDDDGEDFDEAGDNGVAEEGKGVVGKIKAVLGGKGNGKPAAGKLSQRQMEILKKKIEKQKEFLRGEVKKGSVSSSENKSLDTIDQSGTELKKVGEELANGVVITKGIECIVVKKMNQSLLESADFPLADLRYNAKDGEHQNSVQCASEVAEGIRIGTVLGKKLQVRSESRETIFNRQLVGRMDKRMISSLGFGNEHVFYTKEIDAYKKANLHISVDASGSMSGTKWRKTMTNVVALAKAVSMIPNLEIQISFRTTSGELPYIVVAYDSRIDKFIKVKTLFQYLRPGGTTPEGLAFEGVMKQMVGSTTDVDSYFLNISDGEPYFHGKGYNYQGYYASKHTKKMVDKIEAMGIKVMSYFVSEYSGDVDATSGSGKVFKDCYGKAAHYINVTNVNEVVRTMNKLFMNKPAGIE
jgi:hypothetical protein